MTTSQQSENLFEPYKIIRPIAKGGMGQVLLAYDSNHQRYVALKHIREDLELTETLKKRFLKEAQITSGLAHPNIIPILSIHHDTPLPFYTMPFIEGKTLKETLKEIYTKEKETKTTASEVSIRSLMRIFLTVCEAIAYTHAKGVLHRDIKPDNILIGKFGEILIFDWGVAEKLNPPDKVDIDDSSQSASSFYKSHLTRPGKIVGTIPYMAPERIFSKPSTVLTDVYSLGVMLYLILALKLPFKRKSLKDARRHLHEEKWIDPITVAPYRDIPHMLTRICKKCLHPNPKKRYQSVQELIKDVKQYVEGRSEWFLTSELKIDHKDHWQLHENILLAKHIAISQDIGSSEWVSLMVSKENFEGNIKLEANIKMGKTSESFGFLMNIPDLSSKKDVGEGYTLWLSSKTDIPAKLYRSHVEVLSIADTYLIPETWHHIRIEKIENNFYFYIDDELKFSYISYLPLMGKHIGLIYKDDQFELKELCIYTASPSILVSCLAVPDALLAYQSYDQALKEYRRIGASFLGRHEGREALFRAGVTLLEAAKQAKRKKDRIALFEQASLEFEKLRHTPGGPLEYLGKALVYEAMQENEEELKCLELAIRKYPKHPLLSLLFDHIMYRMHQSSRKDRPNTYRFALLLLRFFPYDELNFESKKLIQNIIQSGNALYFIEQIDPKHPIQISIYLAASLAKAHTLLEVLDQLLDMQPIPLIMIKNAIFSLLFTPKKELIQEKMEELWELLSQQKGSLKNAILDVLSLFNSSPLEEQLKEFTSSQRFKLNPHSFLILQYFLEHALLNKDLQSYKTCLQLLENKKLPEKEFYTQISYQIILNLLENKPNNIAALFKSIDFPNSKSESHILNFLYGCYLALKKDEKTALKHFSTILETTSPNHWKLGALFLTDRLGKLEQFAEKGLPFEKYELFKQLYIYYSVTKHPKKAAKVFKLWQNILP